MSAFTIQGTNEDLVCGLYVALLANAAGEAVLHADTADDRIVSIQTRSPEELCAWIEDAVAEHGNAYGSLRTSLGEVVGVCRVSPRGAERVRPVPPSLELLVPRSDRVFETWLLSQPARQDDPLLRAVQARVDPHAEADERVLVPIPGVPDADAILLTPANPDDLYDRAIPYYPLDELAEAFGVAVEPPEGGPTAPGDGEGEAPGDVGPLRQYDAVIHGPIDFDLLNSHPVAFAHGARGTATPKAGWINIEGSLGAFLMDFMVHHKTGSKDGESITLGTCAEGIRQATSMVSMTLIGLDLDNGEDAAAIDARVRDLGWFCIRYTTHSHLKSRTEIAQAAYDQWLRRVLAEEEDDGGAPDADRLAAYLVAERGYKPHIVQGLRYVETVQDSKGVKYVVEHRPLPKFRLLFVLKEPFEFAKRKKQKLAIEEWKRRIAGLAKVLDVWFDRSCVDPSRLFYLPRHPKGAKHFEIVISMGRPIDLDEEIPEVDYIKAGKGPENAFTRLAAELTKGMPRGVTELKNPDLLGWVAKYGDYFQVADFLDAFGQKLDGRPGGPGITARCPNAGNHSDPDDPDDKGCYAVNAGEGDGGKVGYTFACLHNACRDLDRLALLDMMLDQGAITWEDLKNPDYSPSMPEEERADAERPGGGKRPPFEEVEAFCGKLAKGDDDALRRAAALIAAGGFDKAQEAKLIAAAAKAHDGGKNLIKRLIKESREAQEASAYDDPAIIDLLNNYNSRYAFVLIEGKSRIMMEPEGPGHMPRLLEIDAWRNLTAPDYVWLPADKGMRKEPLSRLWLEWRERRAYPGGIVFEPEAEVAGAFNLWRGWPIGEHPDGSWDLLRDHIHDNICRGNAAWFHWFMTWLAQPFQQPAVKMGSAVAIKGEKGTGKSKLFDWYRQLFGPYGLKVSQKSHVTGNFNAHQAGKLLMVCEEAFWAGDPQAGGVLKDLITSSEMTMERKGIDAVQMSNYCRLAMVSNERWIVPAGLKDERRFFVLEISTARQRDIEFFAAIDEQMRSGGLERMMYDLRRWQPEGGNWNILRDPPVTEALVEQGLETLPPDERFFVEMIDEGGCFDGDDLPNLELNENKPTLVALPLLREHWEQRMRRHGTAGARYRLDNRHLAAYVHKYLFPMHRESKRFHCDRLKRQVRGYQVPALKVIRAQLEKVYHIRLDDPNELEELY